jgi:hypothetical protein
MTGGYGMIALHHYLQGFYGFVGYRQWALFIAEQTHRPCGFNHFQVRMGVKIGSNK